MVIAVLALLFGQAMLELELPAYMADIVNIGIVQEGITSAVPEVIRESSLNGLTLFMSKSDADAVRAAYEPLAEHAYSTDEPLRRLKPGADTAAIEKPMMYSSAIIAFTEMMRSGDFEMPEGSDSQEMQLMRQLLSGTSDKDGASEQSSIVEIFERIPSIMRPMMVERITEQINAIPEYMLMTKAIENIANEYKSIGYPAKQVGYITITGLRMLAMVLMSAICSVAVGFFSSRIAAGMGRRLRRMTFERVLSFGSEEINKFSTASLITRTTNDIQQVQMMTVMLLRIVIYSPVMAIGGIIEVMRMNVSMTWIIGLGVLAVSTVITVLLITTYGKFKIMQTLVDKLNLVMREILSGMPVIRAFSTQKKEIERFDEANKTVMRNSMFVNRAMALMFPVMNLVMTSIMSLVIWVGSHQIAEGGMQIGNMMAFMQYTMQIIMSFLMMTMLSVMLPRALVAFGRIQEVLDVKPALADPRRPKQFGPDARGVVTFSNVTFAYPDSEVPILQNISFEALPGQTTAFIGSTGSGKSTVLNLIPRFYDVTEGSVKIDGIDVRDVTMHDLRGRIGYVPQKALLFSGDIESNIKYGDRDISDDAAAMAAEVAQASEFISQKPGGMLEPITQGGDNVSGGQRQRLAIARALAGNPDILIFDDSFSALDFRTDADLRAALRAYLPDKNVLIVAQRISTIMYADQIIVLDKGRMIAQGTHARLMETCPIYRDIADSQLTDPSEVAI